MRKHLYDPNHNAAAMLATIERVKPNYREVWTPSKDTFFKRITQPQLVGIGKDLFGEEWGRGNVNTKKKDLVIEISAAFAHERVLPDEQLTKIDQWTPVGF